MMQSAAKGFAAGRAAARLAMGLAADQAPATASPRGWSGRTVLRGVLPAGKLFFKYVYVLVEMAAVVSWCSKALCPSPRCVCRSVRCSQRDVETPFPSMGAEAAPVRCSLYRSWSQELKFLATGFDKWLCFLLNMGFWLL